MSTTIRTRYQGPRGLIGSRIIATGQGRTMRVPYDDALRSEDMHAAAAALLADRLRLPGSIHTAPTDDPTRYVHTVEA
jgi:hypothetical protein